MDENMETSRSDYNADGKRASSGILAYFFEQAIQRRRKNILLHRQFVGGLEKTEPLLQEHYNGPIRTNEREYLVDIIYDESGFSSGVGIAKRADKGKER